MLSEGLQTLNAIQRKWVYLEPIFARGALPNEQPRFRRVLQLLTTDVSTEALSADKLHLPFIASCTCSGAWTMQDRVRLRIFVCFDLVLIGLLYKAYPNGCQHRLQILLRARPYHERVSALVRIVMVGCCACRLMTSCGN